MDCIASRYQHREPPTRQSHANVDELQFGQQYFELRTLSIHWANSKYWISLQRPFVMHNKADLTVQLECHCRPSSPDLIQYAESLVQGPSEGNKFFLAYQYAYHLGRISNHIISSLIYAPLELADSILMAFAQVAQRVTTSAKSTLLATNATLMGGVQHRDSQASLRGWCNELSLLPHDESQQPAQTGHHYPN